jgi:hypothetical protein
MIRKFAAALVAVVIAVGSIFADEVKGTFVKFADGTLTIKVDDKEKEYKIPADLKIKRKGKDGAETEVVVTDMLGKAKEGTAYTLTVDGGKVTGIKRDRKAK